MVANPDRRHMSVGDYIEKLGMWAFAVIAAWVGFSIRDLTKEVNELRTQLAVTLETQKATAKRLDGADAQIKQVSNDIDSLYGIQQWMLETFHRTSVPKTFRKGKN